MTEEHEHSELQDQLAAGTTQTLRELCDNTHAATIADALEPLPTHEAWQILARIDPINRAEIFSHLDDVTQVQMAESVKRQEMAQILAFMSPDERVDLLKHLPENKREALLPGLAQAEREDIRRLAAHEEGTAGSAMTSDYVTLSPDLTASEAIAKLRVEAPDKETIYYCYVIDGQRKLIGFVSLKDLILAWPGKRIDELMQTEVIFSRDTDDRETAARQIAKYDLIALPVVNEADELVGIITHDDALDILSQEQTEDMEKFMAIGGSHKVGAYLHTSSWQHFKNRSYWIAGLAVVGLISGYILHSFEEVLTSLILLALYIPMVTDSGGNSGSQSATVVIRALALQEISLKDTLRVLFKEFKISLMLAGMLVILSFSKVLFLSHGTEIPINLSLTMIAIAISSALGIQVITSVLVGTLLPLTAAKLKFDPAVVASPALTTLVDITGLIIYFMTVKILLGI